VVLVNRGPSVAALVSFSLRDARTGERVLPARYSDSYLWLAPEEQREIDVSWSAAGVQPELWIDGLNVERARVRL
jgi:Exo-beta-D-glucosaminidase Ig-fold domain